ncbi:hypothetical protein A3F66_01590 [candidate division TM6 bacterium RIFCSPHIGHO2_12_FULL_32_22]|nr:MAG: hypothetical protein A3F66_01590 [candidate division TM6 bacterium RIFCSPHIGHO2_12_FULL_32_22]
MYKKLFLAIFSTILTLNGAEQDEQLIEIKPVFDTWQLSYQHPLHGDSNCVGNSIAKVKNDILFVATEIGYIYVFDLKSKSSILTKNLGSQIRDFDIVPGIDAIAVADTRGWLYLVNFRSGEILNTYKKFAPQQIKNIIYLPIYNYVAIISGEVVKILNAETFQDVYHVSLSKYGSELYSAYLNPFNNNLLISLLNDKLLTVDLRTKNIKSENIDLVDSIYFVDAKKYFSSLKKSRKLQACEVREDKTYFEAVEKEIDGSIKYCDRFGLLVAIASDKGDIEIIDARDRSNDIILFDSKALSSEESAMSPEHRFAFKRDSNEFLNNLKFSSTGKFLASGTRRGVLRIFDVELGLEVLSAKLGYSISLIHFFSDNELLIVTTEGKVLFLNY